MSDYRPAFPVPQGASGNGIGERDYIAIAAMQGELSAQAGEFLEYYTDGCFAELAKKSYKIADAMLAEREQS